MEHYTKLYGKSISLASINLEDMKEYYNWEKINNNSISIKKAKNVINQYILDNDFAIIDNKNKKLVGLIGFSHIMKTNQRSNMWIILNPEINKEEKIKYGVEACDLFLEYCFNNVNLHNIIIKVPAYDKILLEICKNSCMELMCIRKNSSCKNKTEFYDSIYFQCYPNLYENIKNSKNKGQALSKINTENKKITTKYNDESELKDNIIGKDIILKRYKREKEYIQVIAKFLNDLSISIPLGESKINWNEIFVEELLRDIDYVIIKKDKLIGYVRLMDKDLKNHTASLEIVIGDKKEQNKGYATEAVRILFQELKEHGPYVNILSNVFHFNKVSIKLHEKLGFRYIGKRKCAYFANGILNDILIYEYNLYD